MLKRSLNECLIGRWFYFVFKQENTSFNLSKENANSITVLNIKRADPTCNFMNVYEILNLKHLHKETKLNYSNSSFTLEDDYASIVDETLNENNESSSV